MKSGLRMFFTALLIVSFSCASFAQQNQDDAPKKSGTRRQLATIIFAGLGGAVLGLSTLSFYGRPQDKLANIAIGFAVGVIVGTIYTTYQTATKPKDYLDSGQMNESLRGFAAYEFETRLLAEQRSQADFGSRSALEVSPPMLLGYRFSF